MAAYGSMYSNGFCCPMAEAGFSAPMIPLLDTAIFLVVSISVVLVGITGMIV